MILYHVGVRALVEGIVDDSNKASSQRMGVIGIIVLTRI